MVWKKIRNKTLEQGLPILNSSPSFSLSTRVVTCDYTLLCRHRVKDSEIIRKRFGEGRITDVEAEMMTDAA